MIINIRGTHGSGKSTLVRKIMDHLTSQKLAGKRITRQAIYRKGRKQPICYVIGYDHVVVLGHYEGDAGGGTDSIPKVALTYRLAKKYATGYKHVLFEGILAQHSVPRLVELKKVAKVRVVVLKVSQKKAIKSVKKRRKAKGTTAKLDPTNIIREQRAVTNSIARLRAEGIKVKELSRKKAFPYVLSLLEKE